MEQEQIISETQEPEIINASVESVKVLLAKRRKIKLERDVLVGSLELHLQELKDEINMKAFTFDQEAGIIEEEIKELMSAIAHTVKTDSGAAKYRKGSVRASYDTKALDACNDEYVRAAILPYRKETPVSHSVSIEVY